MSGATQVSETYEGEQPVFTGLRSALCAVFRWIKGATKEPAPATWPDELNDHYLRDAGLEHGSSGTLSDAAVYALRVGPRVS